MKSLIQTADSRRSAHACMFLWAFIVGLSFLAITAISKGLSPMVMTAIRFFIAAIAMIPFLVKAPNPWPETRLAWRNYITLGICLAGFFGAMFAAGHLSSAISLSVLYLLVPILTLLAAVGFGVEKWRGATLVWLIVGTIGAILLAMASQPELAPESIRFGEGETIFLGGCLMMALYPVLSKRYLIRKQISPSPILTTFWSLLLGGLLIAIASLLTDPAQWSHFFRAATVTDWLWIVYLGVFSSFLTFFLMQQATLSLLPTQITSYTFLVPFLSMIAVWVVQPDQLTIAALPGALLIGLAIWRLQR